MRTLIRDKTEGTNYEFIDELRSLSNTLSLARIFTSMVRCQDISHDGKMDGPFCSPFLFVPLGAIKSGGEFDQEVSKMVVGGELMIVVSVMVLTWVDILCGDGYSFWCRLARNGDIAILRPDFFDIIFNLR